MRVKIITRYNEVSFPGNFINLSDLLTFLEKNKGSFVGGEVSIAGKQKKYSDYDAFYNKVLEIAMSHRKKLMKDEIRIEKVKMQSAEDAVVRSSIILHYDRYSPDLHSYLESLYSCRFYDVPVVRPVTSFVCSKKNKTEYLNMLKILVGTINNDSNNLYENLYSRLANYVMLVPSLNFSSHYRVHEIVFRKLECLWKVVHESVRLIRSYSSENKSAKIKNSGCDGEVKKIRIVVDRKGEHTVYELEVPEGYVWRGLLLGVDVDWRELLRVKLTTLG